MKIVFWLIGSNAAGKTTQARLLHQHYGTAEKSITKFMDNGERCAYTTFGRIGHVGAVNSNACTGTDTLSTKAAIKRSYQECVDKCDLIVMDSIMATGQTLELLRDTQHETFVYIIHLDFKNEEDNFQRVLERRNKKKGLNEAELSDNTKQNVSSKIRLFRSLYEKMKDNCDLALQVNAVLPEKSIQKEILALLS